MQINENGLQIDSFDTIYTNLVTEFRAIYGQDLTVDASSPAGQFIGIIANSMHDLQNLVLNLYNNFDINFATGVNLNRIIKLLGLSRRPAIRSTWSIVVVSSINQTLLSGFAIRDSSGNKWLITEDVNLIMGNNTVKFYSEYFGPVASYKGDNLSQVEFNTNITSLIANESSNLGVLEESDVSLRLRIKQSFNIASYSTVESMYSNLSRLLDVKSVVIYENVTSTIDNRNIPAHSLWIIIEGGDNQEIAEAIVRNKTAGCGLKGDTEVTYHSQVLLPDGTNLDLPVQVYFDRPTLTDIYIKANIKLTDGSTSLDTSIIKDNLSKIIFNIGEIVIASKLYQYMYTGTESYYITDLQISKDNINFVDTELEPILNERLVINPNNITLNVE